MSFYVEYPSSFSVHFISFFPCFGRGGCSIYDGLVGYNLKGITKKVPLIGVFGGGGALLNMGGCLSSGYDHFRAFLPIL